MVAEWAARTARSFFGYTSGTRYIEPKKNKTYRREDWESLLLVQFCEALPVFTNPQDNQGYVHYKTTKEVFVNFLRQQVAPLRNRIEELESKHYHQVQSLQQQIKVAEQQFSHETQRCQALWKQHEQELQEAKASHSAELASLESRLEAYRIATSQSLREKYEREKQTAERTYNAELATLQSRHDVIYQELQSEQHMLQQTWLQEKSDLEDSLDSAISNAHQDQQRMIASHSDSVQAIQAQHQSELQRLQNTIDEHSTALLARDDNMYIGKLFTTSGLPQKSDSKIKESFSEIEKMVDNIGRLTWSRNSSVFSDHDLNRLRRGDNLRLLKKAIVQDVVWCQLYHFIFASPFRLLGDEGKRLEQEWMRYCGQDPESDQDAFNWPEPSMKAERWRYMTLDQCREILKTTSISEWDSRSRVKNGFGETQDELASSLKSSIATLVDLPPSALQEVDRLVTRMARMWLDFQMHRCRILIRLVGTRTRDPAERIAAIRRGSIKLTVVPSLGRYGSMKGADMDVWTIINGCNGSSLELS